MGSRHKRGKVWREFQRARQGNRCCYCGHELADDVEALRAVTEHRTPIGRGGMRNASGNVSVACKGCDLIKGPLTAGEFECVMAIGGATLARQVSKALSELLSKERQTAGKSQTMGKMGMSIFLDGPPDRGMMTAPPVKPRPAPVIVLAAMKRLKVPQHGGNGAAGAMQMAYEAAVRRAKG